MANIEDLEKGMRVCLGSYPEHKGTIYEISNNVIHCHWDMGHDGFDFSANLKVLDEPLYPIGTKLKVVDPYEDAAHKGQIVKVVGDNKTYLRVEKVNDENNLVWHVSNLGEYEVVEEPKEYHTYCATAYNMKFGIKLSEIDEKVLEKATKNLEESILSFTNMSDQINNKGDDNMNGVNKELNHMDVNLSIDRKNGGYLVKGESEGFKSESVSDCWDESVHDVIYNIKVNKEEEKTRENEIERVEKEIKLQKDRLEELRED